MATTKTYTLEDAEMAAEAAREQLSAAVAALGKVRAAKSQADADEPKNAAKTAADVAGKQRDIAKKAAEYLESVGSADSTRAANYERKAFFAAKDAKTASDEAGELFTLKPKT